MDAEFKRSLNMPKGNRQPKKQNYLSRNAYKEYLNESHCPDYESDEWIIGGKRREYFASKGRYGDALYAYDKVAFNIGFNEWKREKQGKL